jgi:hypothetical protein
MFFCIYLKSRLFRDKAAKTHYLFRLWGAEKTRQYDGRAAHICAEAWRE